MKRNECSYIIAHLFRNVKALENFYKKQDCGIIDLCRSLTFISISSDTALFNKKMPTSDEVGILIYKSIILLLYDLAQPSFFKSF